MPCPVTLTCASFTLGHWIMPFLWMMIVQIGTMKCFYCPQKDAFAVPWDSLSPDDPIILRDKYLDAGQGAVCALCVRSARPFAFFSHRSSSTSSSAPQSVDSQLQVPSASLIVFVWGSHVFDHRVSGIWGCGAFNVYFRVFHCCQRVCHRVPPTDLNVCKLRDCLG